MPKCSNEQMLNAQVLKCSNAQMSKSPNAQVSKCRNAQTHNRTNAHAQNPQAPPSSLKSSNACSIQLQQPHVCLGRRDRASLFHSRLYHDHRKQRHSLRIGIGAVQLHDDGSNGCGRVPGRCIICFVLQSETPSNIKA